VSSQDSTGASRLYIPRNIEMTPQVVKSGKDSVPPSVAVSALGFLNRVREFALTKSVSDIMKQP